MENTNVIEVFSIMSDAIAKKYSAKVQMTTLEEGSKPSFDDLMVELTALQNELTQEGVKFIEKSTAKHNIEKDQLADEVKLVIMNTIQSFVKTL